MDEFLLKDEAARQESIRRARLRAELRTDAELALRRPAARQNWGVDLSYTVRYLEHLCVKILKARNWILIIVLDVQCLHTTRKVHKIFFIYDSFRLAGID